MKVLQYLLAASIVFCLPSCTPKNSSNDLHEHNLHGKVKSVNTYAFIADEKFGEVIKSEWSRNTLLGVIVHGDQTQKFDIDGNLTHESKYYSGGVLFYADDYVYENGMLSRIEQTDSAGNHFIDKRYFYSDKGELIDIQEYQLNGELFKRTQYRHNEEGLIIEEKSIYDDNSGELIKMEYDEFGKLILESVFDIETGELVERNTYEYREGLLENVTYYREDGTIDMTLEKIYNHKNLLIEEIEVIFPDKILDYNISKQIRHRYYNENGDLNKFSRTYPDDPDFIEITEYKYIYDEIGNWISKFEYEIGLLTHVYERDIEYYGLVSKTAKQRISDKRIEAQIDTQESNEIRDGWTHFEIKGIGSISIPPTMEIRQDDSFIDLVADELQRSLKSNEIEMTKSTLIFQPSGTNDADLDALKEYSRVMLNIEHGNKGDYFRLDEKFNFSQNEIQELNTMMLNQIEDELGKININVLKWYPVEFPAINGMSAFKIMYLRQLSDNAPVIVTQYKFFNVDKMIEITMSYRESESEKWKVDFEQVLLSLNIE